MLNDSDFLNADPNTTSELAIYLEGTQNWKGVLNIEYDNLAVNWRDLESSILLLAQHATSALDNAIFSQKQQQQQNKLEALNNIMISVSQSNKIDTPSIILNRSQTAYQNESVMTNVTQSILRQLKTMLQYDRATLQFINQNKGMRLLF